MYAILKLGGHQYRVTSGDRLLIDRIPADVGSTVTLEHVLLVGDESSTQTGQEQLAQARVTATVVAHRRGRKLRVFSYKAKKRHRRTLGYRSQLTELQVDEVLTDGASGSRRSGARTERPEGRRRTAAPKADAPAAEAAAPDDDTTMETPAAQADADAPADAEPEPGAATAKRPARRAQRSTTKKDDDGA